MCLILFAYRHVPGVELLVLANRDEFHARPARQAGFWDDRPDLLAGRDLAAGGTWLGVDARGRLAAVTNFRDPGSIVSDAKSRGGLVTGFLDPVSGGSSFLSQAVLDADNYNGFNLLAYDGRDLVWWSNRSGTAPARLQPGIYGLSNHFLDTPWPKVVEGKKMLSDWLSLGRTSVESYLQLLDDKTTYPAERLPDTGVGEALEIVLSAARITGVAYGTRCSTIVELETEGTVRFIERTFIPEGLNPDTVRFEFKRAEPSAG